VKVTNNGSKYQFVLSGSIGETNAMFIYNITGATEITVDLKDITYINSIGVKGWVDWALKIPKSCKVIFLNCPHVMINQFNMVVGFMPINGMVKSFFAPYHCESCSHEKIELFSEGIEYFYNPPPGQAAINYPEEKPCPKCGEKMEADFFRSKVFKFLPQKP
jgi:hypothetical protein